MTFRARLKPAQQFEQAGIERLRLYGWNADEYGQGQIKEVHRQVLKTMPTPLRWHPDIIASREIDKVPVCVFIEVKSGEGYKKYGYHPIETDCLLGLIEYEKVARVIPIFILTQNWCVHRPVEILNHCKDGTYRGNGSGTPFKLWPVSLGIPFDAIFKNPNSGLAPNTFQLINNN